jgi:hypothetical protein
LHGAAKRHQRLLQLGDGDAVARDHLDAGAKASSESAHALGE